MSSINNNYNRETQPTERQVDTLYEHPNAPSRFQAIRGLAGRAFSRIRDGLNWLTGRNATTRAISNVTQSDSHSIGENRTNQLASSIIRDSASISYENRREQVLNNITRGGGILPAEFANDREIVLAAVNENGFNLQHASDNLKNDREVVLAAVNENGLSLQHASDNLKNDREVVLAAVLHNPGYRMLAGVNLRHDREILLTILQRIQSGGYPMRQLYSSSAADALAYENFLRNQEQLILNELGTHEEESPQSNLHPNEELARQRIHYENNIEQFRSQYENNIEQFRSQYENNIEQLQSQLRLLNETPSESSDLIHQIEIYEAPPPLSAREQALADVRSLRSDIRNPRLGTHFYVHSKDIEARPIEILQEYISHINQGGSHSIEYRDSGHEAIDVGGVQRDFITRLASAVRDLHEGRDRIIFKCDEEEIRNKTGRMINCYSHGKLLAVVLSSEGTSVTGNHVDPTVFKMIHSISPEELESVIFWAENAQEDLLEFIPQTLENKLLTIYLKDHLSLSEDDTKKVLANDRQFIEDVFGYESKNDLLEAYEVNDALLGTLTAAAGMYEVLGRENWHKVTEKANPTSLQDAVEGIEISDEKLKNVLVFERSPNISPEETKELESYLKEWLEENKENASALREFCFAATGSNSLLPGTNLTITIRGKNDKNKLPKWHTCSKEVEFPCAKYDNYQAFKSSLEKSLEYSIGFQMA